MRYFVKLAYNGTPFYGWQIQPNQVSVQEVLENAFTLLLKEKVSLTGCGRTDTGVHAKEYFAHFDLSGPLSQDELEQLVWRLNSFLPQEIVVYEIYPIHAEAHARFDAIARTYKYYVSTAKNPFTFHFAYRVFETLHVDRMNTAAELLLSTTDFQSFSKVNTQVHTFHCKIEKAVWQKEKDGCLAFEIKADRFLRNMVRAIVGTLLSVGQGKLSVSEFRKVIEDKNRQSAGMSVPAHALFLEKVDYPDNFNLTSR